MISMQLFLVYFMFKIVSNKCFSTRFQVVWICYSYLLCLYSLYMYLMYEINRYYYYYYYYFLSGILLLLSAVGYFGCILLLSFFFAIRNFVIRILSGIFFVRLLNDLLSAKDFFPNFLAVGLYAFRFICVIFFSLTFSRKFFM